MSIQVNNITKLYGVQEALKNVSFSIQSGEIVGFLGPNGAGKSTMMKILTCYIPQTTGSASVCGFDVNEASIEVRKNVGYLPEHNPLYHEMYVKEYLEFIAGLHTDSIPKNKVAERIKKMIEDTGLQREQHKKIGALSKGYRQRVGLAQAMIHNPKVLILDEPTTGLDPNQLSEIRALIKEIGKEKTVMLSTHIMQEVEAICSRVIIINKGEIVADDSTANIQSNKKELQIITVEFDKAADIISLNKLPFVHEVNSLGANKYKLFSNSTTDVRSDIFNYAVQNGLAVLTMQREEQKLEDIFKQLTN